MSQSLASWLDLLRCPIDGADLREEGPALVCTSCGVRYPHSDGVVRFVQADGTPALDHEEKVREMLARDADAARYDGTFTADELAAELPPCLATLDTTPGDVVCELGAGTGRFTLRYADRVARVVALDFSLASLLLLRDRLGEAMRAKVLLIQADATRPPLARDVFDKVASFGMLQHLPEEGLRQRVVEAAAGLPRPTGTFTCSVYHWSKQKRQMSVRNEGDYAHKHGHHASGIFYYNFEEPELRRACESVGLCVDRVRGVQIGFRGARLLGPLRVPFTRLLAGTSWGIARSHLLLVRGRKPESYQ